MEQHEGTVDSGALESRLKEYKKESLKGRLVEAEEILAKLDKVGEGLTEIIRHYGHKLNKDTTVYELIGDLGKSMVHLDDMVEKLREELDGLDD